jgi:hypothetical protein
MDRLIPAAAALLVFGVVIAPALQAHDAGPRQTAQASGSIPLGDNRASLSGPRKGYVFLCRAMAGGGGAFRQGDWIQGGHWNPSQKTVSVQGDVAWPNAFAAFETTGDRRVVRGNALPSHGTGAFPVRPSDPAFQYDRNPNSIRPHDVLLTLPRDPQPAAAPSCVGGEVGIALTGVFIFNGMDAMGRDAPAYEIQDSHGGHPQPGGVYHYHHVTPKLERLGIARDGMVLVGYAFDGFGIFGGVEHGRAVGNDDLDECHGHVHAIPWDGHTVAMYHYHATGVFPYTVGCFKGIPVRFRPPGGPPGGPGPLRPPPR